MRGMGPQHPLQQKIEKNTSVNNNLKGVAWVRRVGEVDGDMCKYGNAKTPTFFLIPQMLHISMRVPASKEGYCSVVQSC